MKLKDLFVDVAAFGLVLAVGFGLVDIKKLAERSSKYKRDDSSQKTKHSPFPQ